MNDIEIHFLHYANKKEAVDKWTRRLERMRAVKDQNQYFFRICDRDESDEVIFKRFHELPYKNKLSFAIFDFDSPEHKQVLEHENKQCVEDGVKLYRTAYKYIDLIEWINSGRHIQNAFSKLKSKFKLI